MKKTKPKLIVLSVISVIALILTYSNHFYNGFHFDDEHTIVENVHIQSLKNIPEFFTNPKMFSSKPDHWGLRPLVTTSLAIDYWLGAGLHPFYFHLSTFIWYIILCVLLFFIFKNLSGRFLNHRWTGYIALIATAWYALHPVNAETINYIISRSDVLSTLCIVGSFSIYVFYPDLRKWYLYIIPAVIGVFAKETVLVLVPLLFFYTILFERNFSLADLFKFKNIRAALHEVVMLVPVFVAIVIVQAYTLLNTPASPTGFTNPFLGYILTQCYIWAHYFYSFFLPLHLSADTDMVVITNPLDYKIILGMIFIILFIYITFRTSKVKQTKPVAFGLTWFAFALLPTSIAPLAEVMNDHRMFFPFIGLSLAIVYTIGLLAIRYENKFRAIPRHAIFIPVMVIVGLSCYAYGTYQRNKVWKSEETLWYDVTIKSPENGRGHMNYGLTQMSRANYPKALACFEKALMYAPQYNILNINLGIVKNAMHKPEEAEVYFKNAISYTPGLFEPYYYYAAFLKTNNRLSEAQQMCEKAVTISPYFMDGRYLLMEIYKELELWDQLAESARQTLSISPLDPKALQYADAGSKKLSKLDIHIVQAANYPTPANYLNLSLELFNKGFFEKSIEACIKAIQLKPDYADAYSNMCAAYNRLEKWSDAIEAGTHALAIDPTHKLASGNLNWAKSHVKK